MRRWLWQVMAASARAAACLNVRGPQAQFRWRRRLQPPRRCDYGPSERAQERLELPAVVRGQAQRLQLAVTHRRGWRAVVVGDHVGERGDLSGVHERRALSDVTERRRLVGADQLLALGDRELQLRAFAGLGVAPAARACELARNGLPDAGAAATVHGERGECDGHARVVEVVVGEERAVVARDAVRLADEVPEPRLLVAGKRARRVVRAAGELALHVTVEARGREADAPLERRDGLAEIRVDARDVVLPRGRNRAPGGGPHRIGDGACMGGQTVEHRDPTERALVPGAVGRVGGDDVCILRAVAAVLYGALERAKRLRPLTVRASVPELPGRISGAGDRHGAAARRADALSQRDAVLQVLRRHVAARARHLAVRAQARVEEELAPEPRGERVVAVPVGRVRGKRVEAGERERAKRLALFRGPASTARGVAVERDGGGRGECERDEYGNGGAHGESPGRGARATA